MPAPERHIRRVELALSVGLSALCLACHPPPGPEPTDQPHVEVDPLPGVEEADAESAEDAKRAAARAEKTARVDLSARRILYALAEARGLPVKGEFDVELITTDEVRAFILQFMHEEMSAEEIAMTSRVQSALGVIPVGRDSESVMLELLGSGVLGIYDYKRDTLLIGDYVEHKKLGMVVGHEGAHALQDMHFELEKINRTHPGRNDSNVARTFLLEGDAQASYLAYATGDEGIGSIGDDLLDQQADQVLLTNDQMGVPHPTFTRMMQMPYTDGTRTIIQLARSRGWEAVDALYTDLPATTEQMLHLDKLAKREGARPVTIDPAAFAQLLPDHQLASEDDFGEAALLAMLADVREPARARAAAAGWGGDRFVALERENDPAAAPLVIAVIAWDTSADAKQFEPAFRDYLQKYKPEDHVVARKGDKVIFATHFREVLDTPDAAKQLSAAIWSSFEVGKAPKN